MHPLRKSWLILRYMGPRLVALRAAVFLRRRLKLDERTYAPRPWASLALDELLKPEVPRQRDSYAAWKRDQRIPFLFPLGRPPQVPSSLISATAERKPPLTARLAALREKKCTYFFDRISPAAMDWCANPFLGASSPPARIWCHIPDFSKTQGDIRYMWEPARAAWAIDIARGKAYGLAADAAELFWQWLDSWMAACPPFQGVHWKCGQESSVRFIGLALGFWSVATDAATTPARWEQFARLAWATGYRVAHHIGYAVSQKNNHALSEACGLLLVSHLFPEFREAEAWQALGRRVMTQELRRQIYADGSYVQHSMNYHRVMLHDALLALRLAELAERPFERDIYDRVGRAAEFLFQMMEPSSGRLPQYGNNDGANVLPLSECDFNDYRPVIQAVHFLVHRKRLLAPGPWDEDLLWLFGPAALEVLSEPPRAPVSMAFDAGGYYTLRQGESWGMIRCHTYRDRPAHLDMLHFDFWWRGQNILQDAGTYLYYAPDRPKKERYFKSLAAHNTVQIDDQDPVELASRFLWLPWPRAQTLRYKAGPGERAVLEGEHATYDRAPWNVLHRRAVAALGDDHWLIVDDLLGAGRRRAVLRWHLEDTPYELDASAGGRLMLSTEAGQILLLFTTASEEQLQSRVVRGLDEPDRVQGWISPYYGAAQPIPVLEITAHDALPLRFITAICPGGAEAVRLFSSKEEPHTWSLVTMDRRRKIRLAPPDRTARGIIQDLHQID